MLPIRLPLPNADGAATRFAALPSITTEDLDRTSRHLELGPVTMRELLNSGRRHDAHRPGGRAVMQPFIPASGPWRFYFADHDVEAVRPGS
jgi:hypothetical protein